MTFDEAYASLKTAYEGIGLEVADLHAREIFFKQHGTMFKLLEDDIKEYAESKELCAAFECGPNPCSLVGQNYREQAIRPLDPMGGRMFFGFRDADEIVFGSKEPQQMYVRLGRATPAFVNYFRFHESLRPWVQRRLRIESSPYRERDASDLRSVHYRPYTIAVHNLPTESRGECIRRSTPLIESCLFQVSLLRRAPFQILEELPPQAQSERRPAFRFDEITRDKSFPLPRARFNADLVRFYQLGQSSDVPVLQFLAYYQVLEYHFIAVSDEALYRRLAARINDPRFQTTPPHLDRIVVDVDEHKKATDETEMLAAVLEKFVSEADVIRFIEAYEKHLGEKWYTSRRTRFGAEAEIKLQAGHVFRNVARVIKSVRNALVHSSDRHDRTDRHVPFSKGTEIVQKDVPLVRYLAERVIVASALPDGP